MKSSWVWLRRWHLGVDGVLVAGAWLGAYWLRFSLNSFFGVPINRFANYLQALPIILAAWFLSCRFFGLYQQTRTKTSLQRMQDLLQSIWLGFLLLCSIGFLFKGWDLGRTVVFFSSLFNLLFLSISWLFFYRIEQQMLSAKQGKIKALLLGASDTAIRVIQRIEDHPDKGYSLIGCLTSDEKTSEHSICNYPILGTFDSLHEQIEQHQIEEVFIASPDMNAAHLLALIDSCAVSGVTFWMVSDAFDVLNSNTAPNNVIGDIPFVQLSGKEPSFVYAWGKRCLDLFGATILLLLSLPMWLYWGLRIKLDSSGTIFFTQERCGLDGKRFVMYKFRTMAKETNPYQEAPREQTDPRVTKYGEWLRKTSIDELPQLLNVLKGEMSLVGPRPEMPFIVDTYEPWQRRRLSVRPGLTGLWQILGRKDLPMHENLQYDFYYIRNRSLSLDLSILMRTVIVVLLRKGAY